MDQVGAGLCSRDHRARTLKMKRAKVQKPKPAVKRIPARGMPNREAIISKMKRVGDSGRILEEDRS